MPSTSNGAARTARGPRQGRRSENGFTFGTTDNGFTLQGSGSPNAPFSPQASGVNPGRAGGGGNAAGDSGEWSGGRASRVAALPGSATGGSSRSSAPIADDSGDVNSFSAAPTRVAPTRRASRRMSGDEREADAPPPTPKPTPKPLPTRAPEQAPTPIPRAPEPPPKAELPAPEPYRKARPLNTPEPPYPDGIDHEGHTRLRLSIGVDGDVTGAELTGSSGSATLDAAAVRHVRRRWKFAPARRGDTPVASTMAAIVHWKRN